uniref:Uncharacterized protein n=1 Tax=Cacopsylla melanoneura TaxID=428564 RepID=A0A8D9EAA0_9HEMI
MMIVWFHNSTDELLRNFPVQTCIRLLYVFLTDNVLLTPSCGHLRPSTWPWIYPSTWPWIDPYTRSRIGPATRSRGRAVLTLLGIFGAGFPAPNFLAKFALVVQKSPLIIRIPGTLGPLVHLHRSTRCMMGLGVGQITHTRTTSRGRRGDGVEGSAIHRIEWGRSTNEHRTRGRCYS